MAFNETAPNIFEMDDCVYVFESNEGLLVNASRYEVNFFNIIVLCKNCTEYRGPDFKGKVQDLYSSLFFFLDVFCSRLLVNFLIR